MSEKKISMSTPKVNVIVTCVFLAIALAITIVTGVQFTSFRNYQAEFVLRDGVVDQTIKFHEYSPYLENTIGDSDIYVINGTENTVAVVKEANAAAYAEEIPLDAKIGAIAGSDQLAAARKTIAAARDVQLDEVTIATYTDKDELIKDLSDGNIDVAIMKHADAKVIDSSKALVIAGATVEYVPSLLVLGGTHPNEPAGQLAATVILEQANVQRGILYVVTELNKSGYSHSQPQEATTWYYTIENDNGSERVFKYGARGSNIVDQWPTPDVYTHSSGQQLSGTEVRNINRAYPGSPDGTYTEKIAYAMLNFVKQNNVTMVIDLHEASPEYEVINAGVYHEDTAELMSRAELNSDAFGGDPFPIKFNASAPGLHGLTHRELGDFTGAYVVLFETSNASQGKVRGKFTEDLILYDEYKDIFYETLVAGDPQHKIIYGAPVSIDERVGRHTKSVCNMMLAYNEVHHARSAFTATKASDADVAEWMAYSQIDLGQFVWTGVPTYDEVDLYGVGHYLLDSQRTK